MRISIALAFTLILFASPAQAGDPAAGATTFTVYEAYLSPAQQPGEESETPPPLKKSLGATQPSTPRDSRKSRGYGQIRFARDLSKAFVDVQVTGVNAADILMFHIHCGAPGSLGPVVVDLGKVGDMATRLTTGKFSIEITNKDIVFVNMLPKGFKFKLPESCPVDIGLPTQVKTISGLEYLARKGVLYFNLHTKAHTFYGEARGQIYAAPGGQAAR